MFTNMRLILADQVETGKFWRSIHLEMPFGSRAIRLRPIFLLLALNFGAARAGLSDSFLIAFNKSRLTVLTPAYSTYYGSAAVTESLTGFAIAPVSGDLVLSGHASATGYRVLVLRHQRRLISSHASVLLLLLQSVLHRLKASFMVVRLNKYRVLQAQVFQVSRQGSREPACGHDIRCYWFVCRGGSDR